MNPIQLDSILKFLSTFETLTPFPPISYLIELLLLTSPIEKF